MIKIYLGRWFEWADALLNRPSKVFLICLFFLVTGLVFDGTLFRLWFLHRDSNQVVERISNLKTQLFAVEDNLKRAQDPVFIENQAREHFDMAAAGELIFVFSDSETNE